ncbi:hypothetical protein K493DRAFT_300604 [Basidiobolus meristosporus CBS 931.73]|uniref:Transferase n=1 Tax=Basidiobolus meristosporus CBS 931.73 TaxID=1314790 RepID=A0A1Y1YGG8_9FUNG|nr:hypothetical protein K493DRAFT_300604 [Basidiobolus meristosporus CBS 931.73]|eukprot:ORX97077.1 hypothetical protein K493DRAFT_300604 [Basidiobolus meristosporus CBS 931.73]
MMVGSPFRLLQPATPLPSQAIQLNDVDLFQLPFYVYPTFIFRNDDRLSQFLPTEKLIEGLRQALNHFPILYGRLGRTAADGVEVQPSGEGVPVYESQTDTSVQDLEPHWCCSDIPVDSDSYKLDAQQGDPLCVVQITRFAGNTGIALTVILHHFCVDIFSAAQFTRTWADFVRGCSPPECVQNRALLQARPTGNSTPPPSVDTSASMQKPRTVALVLASAKNLNKLKEDVQATLPAGEKFSVPWISTLDALHALLIDGYLRFDDSGDDRIIAVQVNIRNRAPSRIPANYFGNAVLPITIQVSAKDVLSQPLGYVAAKVRHEINQLDEEAVLAMIDRLGDDPFGWPTHESLMRTFNTMDLGLTDWSKANLYAIDFGHGPPTRFRVAKRKQGPPAMYIETPPDLDGLEIFVTIPTDFFEQFRTDPQLNKYLTILS